MCDPVTATVGATALGVGAAKKAVKMPDIPTPTPPPQMQDAKSPASMATRRRQRSPLQGGTLLTGPAGVAPGATVTGGNTLLGS